MTDQLVTPRAARPAKSLTEGYALCTPGGTLLGHTYRKTPWEAIAVVYADVEHRDDLWRIARGAGWTVEHVYARIFTPAYFVDVVPQPREGAEI